MQLVGELFHPYYVIISSKLARNLLERNAIAALSCAKAHIDFNRCALFDLFNEMLL